MAKTVGKSEERRMIEFVKARTLSTSQEKVPEEQPFASKTVRCPRGIGQLREKPVKKRDGKADRVLSSRDGARELTKDIHGVNKRKQI